MLDSLFGAQLGTTAKFAVALVLVLGLIGITALILKRFGGTRMPSSGGGRNRQPRLAVLDSAIVDTKRRLVLIRRDNSEHLLLIGGPSDVVVETNINRAGPLTSADRRPRGAQQPDLEAFENSLLGDGGFEEPAPQPAPRPRERAERELPPRPQPRLQPQPQPEPINELPLAPALRPEPQPEPAAFSPPPPLPHRQLQQPPVSAPVQAQPAPAPVPVAAPAPVRPDPQYADMAQKLEAALRNPASAPAPRAPEPRVAQPAAPQPRPAPPMPQTRAMPAAPAPAAAQPVTPAQPKQDAPNPFDSLEAEMASLLGQDKKR